LTAGVDLRLVVPLDSLLIIDSLEWIPDL
jgi:hypothetical protein